MKRILLAVLLLPALTFAQQSSIPKAVNETLNLAPRFKKGDLQRYELRPEIRKYDADGIERLVRRDLVSYSQYCSANSPETGLDYEVTIDSFSIGTFGDVNSNAYPMQTVRQLDGYRTVSKIRRNPPVENGCYDLDISFPDSLWYVEVFDFLEHYVYLRLIEQLRYSAGRQLNRIGDTAVVAFPAPICFTLNKVVNKYHLKLASQVLELSGLTKFGNRGCAIVKIRESVSPLSVELWAGPSYSLVGEGRLTITGEMTIALDNGQIVAARIIEDHKSKIQNVDGTSSDTHNVKSYSLRQVN